MCLTVYLGAGAPLRSIEWNDDVPAFYARPLAAHEDPERRILSFPHVAMLGAHSGCGCGFVLDGADDPAEVRRSREALARYASDALRSGAAELYVCWGGEVELPAARQLTLTPDELPEREDWSVEGTHVRLVAHTAPS